jgi:CBS domain-containing protein
MKVCLNVYQPDDVTTAAPPRGLAPQRVELLPALTTNPVARYLRDVVERMERQKLTNLPVTTSDGRLVGLLLRKDAEPALAGKRS